MTIIISNTNLVCACNVLQYVLLDACIMLTTIKLNYLILLKVKVNVYLFSSYRDATLYYSIYYVILYMSNARVSSVCDIASMTACVFVCVVYMHVYGLIAWTVT